jgi:uncharacterized damage-inducible protein DinB
MTAEAIKAMLGFNGWSIDKLLDGITEQESLFQPQEAGNCVNWVLGHIIASRHGALKLLGNGGIWGKEELSKYDRGGSPVTDVATALSLESLRADEAATRELIAEALGAVSEADLSQEVSDKTLGETVGAQLVGFQWHEGYHVGQLGLLRRVLGKKGVFG